MAAMVFQVVEGLVAPHQAQELVQAVMVVMV
jgi:hypothetical protein